MNNFLTIKRFHFLCGMLFLCIPLAVGAQTNCGDIVVFDDGYEERESIDDCSNPFNADDPVPFNATFTLAGETVTEGSEITIEPNSIVAGSFELDVPLDNFNRFPLTLFKASSSDYYLVSNRLDTSFSLESLSAGDYTAVFVIEEAPVLSEQIGVFEKIRNFFVTPALAFFPDFAEVVTINFSISEAVSTPEGASSVLFLPGIKASRLYLDDDKLWEPGSNSDIQQLEMTAVGESINDVYVDEVVDELITSKDIYKSFLAEMDELVDDEIINDFLPFAYDWRYSVFNVATQDVEYETETKRLLDEVLRLADESYTGKVTIIGHSNGGLVAKAFLEEYGDDELVEKIDKFVMIGTPQLGTPKAIASSLHGLDEGIAGGLIVNANQMRTTSRNIPGAYTLLPSEKFFSKTGYPVISAENSTLAEPINQYGLISSADVLQDFMLDSLNTREQAVGLNEPAIINELLSDEARDFQSLLDDWVAPAGVEVYEVVGTGLATLSAIEYREYACGVNNPFCFINSYLKPVPVFTDDGDATVMSVSAEGYEGDKTTMIIDLFDANAGLLNPNRKHANLTESSQVQNFLDLVIKFPYLTDSITVPEYSEVSRQYTIVGVHSPVEVVAEDASGNQTGITDGVINEDIPNTQYLELGESKYIVLPKESSVEISLNGIGEGLYSLSIDELVEGGEQEPVSLLSGATSTAAMVATFSITEGSYSTLETDLDGDGGIDVIQTLDGEVIEEEPEDEYSYNDLIASIDALEIKKVYKQILLRQAYFAKYLEKKSQKRKFFARIETRVLKSIERRISRYEKREIITSDEYDILKLIIKNLK